MGQGSGEVCPNFQKVADGSRKHQGSACRSCGCRGARTRGQRLRVCASSCSVATGHQRAGNVHFPGQGRPVNLEVEPCQYKASGHRGYGSRLLAMSARAPPSSWVPGRTWGTCPCALRPLQPSRSSHLTSSCDPKERGRGWALSSPQVAPPPLWVVANCPQEFLKPNVLGLSHQGHF